MDYGFMIRNSSSSAPQDSPGRRTVLLALDPDIATLLGGIYEAAARAGWTVLDLRYYGMKVPRHCRPDGVLFRMGPDAGPVARRFLRLDVPVVQIDDLLFPKTLCCVLEDRRAVGRAAAQHFAERGFKNLAFLHSETYPDKRTLPLSQSFVKRARQLGAKVDLIAVQRPGRITPWDRVEKLARLFEKEISRLPLPLGIFTYHDGMAIRICQYCQVLGLHVPEQVAVLGRGNEVFQCDFARTPLSSVDMNYFAQGLAAAELLEKLMDGGAAPQEPVRIPPVGVVTRKSTDVLAIPDVDTARALRYLWEHLGKPLTVRKVAAAVAISRRSLDRHFHDYLGRSLIEELNRKRIERACELLTGTELSAGDIGRQVGFNSDAYFCVVFRKLTGTTPKRYRWAQIAKGRHGELAGAPGRE